MSKFWQWLKDVFTKKVEPQPPLENVAPVRLSAKDPNWLKEAKKHDGKKESDPEFNKEMSKNWKLVGLSGYKTIAGNKYAWCGLFVAAALAAAGVEYSKRGAGAKNWAKYGVAIDWKQNGIPRGAILHINHNFKCEGASSGNHVAFANGDCAAADLLKKGATIDLFGGNQQNKAQVSTYSVKEICAVRWPKDHTMPGKVEKSENCTSGSESGGSTR